MPSARKIRKRSCAMMSAWSLRQLRLEWASTNQMSGSWYIMICRKIWRAIIRRPDGPAGTDCQVNACCFSARAMLPSNSISSIEKSESEARIARAQLQQMVHYAETRECRRATLLSYFGEEYPSPRAKDAIIASLRARRLMAQFRRRNFSPAFTASMRRSGFGFRLNHIVDVFRGADTEAIRQRGHNELSTYGIGRDLKRDPGRRLDANCCDWGSLNARREIRHLKSLTLAGRTPCAHRTPVTLTKQIEVVARDKQLVRSARSSAMNRCLSVYVAAPSACG